MSRPTVTVAFPQALYDRLKQRAADQHRSIEDEVILALAAALGTSDEIPADLATTLDSMGTLDDEGLMRMARCRVTEHDAARLAELAEKRQRSGLTGSELLEAEELVERHDRVLVVRAEATAHLTRRGYDVRPILAGE